MPTRMDGPDLGAADPALPAVVFTTSGSTGMPKLAAHSGAGVLRTQSPTPPPSRSTTATRCCAVTAVGGVRLQHGDGRPRGRRGVRAGTGIRPRRGARRYGRLGVTHVVGGDDLVLRLAEAWKTRVRDLSAWRWWGVADFQGRSRELAQWARNSFGTSTSGVYGSSELFALTAHWPMTEPEPGTPGGRRAGSAPRHHGSRRRPGGPAQVLPQGAVGELQFRGPMWSTAISVPMAPTAFTADGWFHSGDLGALIDEGAFSYVCRMGDALRLRGFLVDPTEIERRLAAHPEVHTAKVVGIADADGATVAVGFVVPKPQPARTRSALRNWCAQELARSRCPSGCTSSMPCPRPPVPTERRSGPLSCASGRPGGDHSTRRRSQRGCARAW